MKDDGRAPPITVHAHAEWFHGSPLRLERLRVGSTVTPVRAYAMAMSHKPKRLEVGLTEDSGTGVRRIVFTHDGEQDGLLYRVVVTDPGSELEQHPGSKGALGEEMLTTAELPLEFLQNLPLKLKYEHVEIESEE